MKTVSLSNFASIVVLAPAFILAGSVFAQVGPGSSLVLSGTAHVQVAANASLALSNQLTFEAWVSMDKPVCNTILSRGSGSDAATDYIFQIGWNGTSCGAQTKVALFVAGVWHYSSSQLTTNTWYHLAVTYDGANVKFYINGSLDSTTAETGPIYQSGSPLYLGRQGQTCDCNFMQGSLDEIRIWNTARTADQISSNRNHALTGAEANLVAYYRFDEGSGSTAGNSAASGSVNNGTLFNSPAWKGSGAQFAPDLVVGVARNLSTSTNTATLTGTVNPGNLPAVVYFEYNDYSTNKSSATSIGAANSPVPVALPIASASSASVYYYRMVAFNSAGTNYSDYWYFQLSLVTDSATSITANSAILKGFVATNVLPATVYFQWGPSTSYGNLTVTTNVAPGGINEFNAVSRPAVGLLPLVNYHFRVVSSSSAGTFYGNDVTFVTLPDVFTDSATNITVNSATLNGELATSLLPATVYFQWGTSSNYGNLTATTNLVSGGANPFLAVSFPIAGLVPTTNYHYRLVCSNSAGTKYGSDVFFGLLATNRGTWVPLANPPPAPVAQFLLLTDGTVLAEDASTSDNGPGWFRLTPDAHGSYVNGTWSPAGAMHDTRRGFSSIVLRDGRLFVAGGEYGTGAKTAEIYNPVSDSWSIVSVPPGIVSSGFYDSTAVLLSNGKVLIAPVSPATSGETAIYDPVANTWTNATLFRGYYQDEGSWVKLRDDSILTIDPFGTNSERYIPTLNAWVNDANVPAALYDPYGGELGPASLLPNGKAIFFGSMSHTAIYTPSGTTNAGTWAAGPDFPNIQGMPDASSAMLINGKILCEVGQAPHQWTVWTPPVTFYEYDYVNNSFTLVTAPGGAELPGLSFVNLMLDLPDGSVLLTRRQTDLYIYRPNGPALVAGKPTVSSITTNNNGSVHLTGTLFNGLGQGAAYGDDHQMDSNFPLVRFTDLMGTVRYGRTTNWSSTGVQTGTNVVSTDCALPPGASLNDFIEVVANGISSADPVLVVTNPNGGGPGSLGYAITSATNNAIITFAPGLAGQRIILGSGAYELDKNLTIDASALASPIQIDGNHNSRIFNVAAGVAVTLNALVLTNGYAGTNFGGAIFNAGTLNLTHCTLAGNSLNLNVSGVQSYGGAIYNSGGNVTLQACTLFSNSGLAGGALFNEGGNCVVRNCTFADNRATYGAAIFNRGPSSVIHCTLSGNGPPAGVLSSVFSIENMYSVLAFSNSISAGTNVSAEILNYASSTVLAGGTNILKASFNNQGGTFVGMGSLLAVADPALLPLGNYGGPTLTMPPLPGSPAIDAGSDTAAVGLATDQRGQPRIASAHVDVGSVELQTPTSVVTTSADSGPGSLRDAVTLADVNTRVTFAPGMANQIILLTSGQIVAGAKNLSIDGSQLSAGLWINANASSRIFQINAGAGVTMNSLILINGNDSLVGGIANSGNLTLNNCTVADNVSSFGTGAIDNYGNLSLNNCTLAINSGLFYGGIVIHAGSLVANNCTIVSNTASAWGGLFVFSGTAVLNNCIVSDNGNPPNVGGTFSGSHNLVDVPDLNLDYIAHHGGLTPTMPPLPGSPAVDAGDDGTAAGLATDQRGLPRFSGDHVDIGAAELQLVGSPNPAVLTSTVLLGNGMTQLQFSNQTGASFRVFASSNLSLMDWSMIGFATEVPANSGQFQFTDPQATNNPQRFYRVRSP